MGYVEAAVSDGVERQSAPPLVPDPAENDPVRQLGGLLRQLRRRHARQCGEPELTYRELAARTGWSFAAIGEYFTGKTLPPTDRFDVLIGLLGATGPERGALATARDRAAEHRRGSAAAGAAKPAPEVAGPDPPRAAVVPRTLPPPVRHFAGRSVELRALTGLAAEATGPEPTPLVAVLTGTAGVGKTALAVHWAHRSADMFPDGQLYVNLRGFHPGAAPVTAAEAVRGFLHALDVPPYRMPAGLAAQTAHYRSLLAGRRMLVVLDNARDADQVRPLLPGVPGCLVIVTSRDQLAGLVAAEGAHPVTLAQLDEAEAEQLLARRLGPDRLAAEPAAARDIIARCARLPLALAIVAARAVTDAGAPLGALAAQLRDGGRLDLLAGTDASTDVRTVFSWSYRALSPPAARLFRLLGLHPGPDLGVPAAASLAGLPTARVAPLLDELSRAHLLTEGPTARYGMHDLLRAYAGELADRYDPPDERAAATRRALDHYLHTAYAADRQLKPHRQPVPVTPAEPAAVVEAIGSPERAQEWFAAEHEVLRGAVGHAAAAGLDAVAWRLCWALTTFFDRSGRWHEWADAAQDAVAAARQAGDPAGQAHSHRGLGVAWTRLAEYDGAEAELRRSLALFTRLDDARAQADTHRSLDFALERQGRHAEALAHAGKALELYGRAGHRSGQAEALNAVGWLHCLLGDPLAALTHCRQALAVHQELDNRYGQAGTWDSIGYAHHRLGHHRQAAVCYRNALALWRDLGVRYYEADTLRHLGDVHRDAGVPDSARDAWRRALAILDPLGHPDAALVRDRLHELDPDRVDPGWRSA